MPTKEELHFMVESDLEFGLSAASNLGSEHSDHIPPSVKRFSRNKGKIVGNYSLDENKNLRFSPVTKEKPPQQKPGGPQ